MSREQLKTIDNINNFYKLNNIKRYFDVARFAVLNDRERDEELEREKEFMSKMDKINEVILSN